MFNHGAIRDDTTLGVKELDQNRDQINDHSYKTTMVAKENFQWINDIIYHFKLAMEIEIWKNINE